MSTEQLLIQRFECTGTDGRHYPRSPFNVGDILEVSGDCAGNRRTGSGVFENSVYKPEWYPHLFKKLPFWEHREEKDLPEYIKWKSGKIDKVSSWDVNYDNEGETVFTVGEYSYYADDSIYPSTLEEYNQYIKSKQ